MPKKVNFLALIIAFLKSLRERSMVQAALLLLQKLLFMF
jgi:hypothetical protein